MTEKKLPSPSQRKGDGLVLVTPADAQRYLDAMHKNRTKSKLSIGVHEENLRAGTFYGRISPVFLDDADCPWDGQHRFKAIVNSGEPGELYFIRGVTAQEAEYIDTGRKRVYADVLKMRGVPDYKRQSVLAKYAALYERYGVEGVRNPNTLPVTQEAMNAHLNTDAVLTSMRRGQALCKATRCNESMAAYAVWRTGQAAPDGTFTADPFWESVRTGENLNRDDPAKALRDWLLGERRSAHRVSRRLIEAYAMANSYNKHVTGQRYARVTPPYSRKPNGDLYFAAADVPDFLPPDAGNMSRTQLSRTYAEMKASRATAPGLRSRAG